MEIYFSSFEFSTTWVDTHGMVMGYNIQNEQSYATGWCYGPLMVPGHKLAYTVYPKKYAHGFCFAVLCCGYTLTDFPISIRLTSLALWQSNDCPSASKATLMNMDKCLMWIHYERLHNHNKAKHNKTVCIFLGIYCSLACNLHMFFSGSTMEFLAPCVIPFELSIQGAYQHVMQTFFFLPNNPACEGLTWHNKTCYLRVILTHRGLVTPQGLTYKRNSLVRPSKIPVHVLHFSLQILYEFKLNFPQIHLPDCQFYLSQAVGHWDI